MSKKILLKRSFADVVKDTMCFEKEVIDVENESCEFFQGEPGLSVITPVMRCFPYVDLRKTQSVVKDVEGPKKRRLSVPKRERRRPDVIVIDSSSDEELPEIWSPTQRQSLEDLEA